MRRTTILLMLWFMSILAICIKAEDSCTPDICGMGLTDNGVVCDEGYCYRNCTGLTCSGSWTQVFADGDSPQDFYFWESDPWAEDSSDPYNASNTSACYRFEFSATGQSVTCDVDDLNYDPPGSETNCDCEAIAGFWESGKPLHPWYENLTAESDVWEERYWGDVSGSAFDYILVAARGHTNKDSVYDSTYDDNLLVDYSIYCAPSSVGCNNITGANYSVNCDVNCYNKATYTYIAQGILEDDEDTDSWVLNHQNFRNKDYCPTEVGINHNNYNYPMYKVYTMPVQNINSNPSCSAPYISGVNIVPLDATVGNDLICNYTYSHPEDYEEKDSTYEWWKNGANQNINSQILGKENLSINDKWYCKVTPSDGLLNGTTQNSDNVTILSTIQNPKMYIGNSMAWNLTGYFSDSEIVLDFQQELENALQSCTPDAEGYCNVTLPFSSDASGTLNLSELGIYYEDLPDDSYKFYLQNTSDENIAWFGNEGNIVLKGSCSAQATCTPPSNSIIFRNASSEPIAYIDSGGNLCVENGDCSDQSSSCSPATSAFVMRNASQSIVSYIDFTGDLCLTGRLYENSNP